MRRAALVGLLLLAAAAWAQEADESSAASLADPGVTSEAAFGPVFDAVSGPTAEAGSPTQPDATAEATPPRGLPDLRTLSHYDAYDIVRGPAFLAAWVIFALGLAFRIWQYITLTARPGRHGAGDRAGPAGGSQVRIQAPGYAGRGSARADQPFILGDRSLPSRIRSILALRARRTILGSNPVMAAVSSVFHVLLFGAPLLLPAHNILFDLTFRISLPTLAEPVIDALTLIVIAAGIFFLVRRLAIPRVRALTTGRDWLVLALVMAPFVTAYLAYHQLLDYRIILLAHMVVGELVIAAIPFTAIGHMPFILFARFFTAGEYAWRPGNRLWR